MGLMVLAGVLLGGGGLHGEGSGGSLCPWFELLYPPESKVFGCCEAELSPAAAAMLGAALALAEVNWPLRFFTM